MPLVSLGQQLLAKKKYMVWIVIYLLHAQWEAVINDNTINQLNVGL